MNAKSNHVTQLKSSLIKLDKQNQGEEEKKKEKKKGGDSVET